jgi:medium-chain acyl-[acyl-carrier-protein] hydrolase
MKVSLKKELDFTDVDSDFVLTLHSLVKKLQEAAISHSNKAGQGSIQLIEDETAWILYQSGIEIYKWPSYEENIKIITWHRGIKGVKAYREFEVYSDNKKIATAAGVYLYYDIKNRKVRRIPKNVNAIYSIENELAFKEDLEQWKPIAYFSQDFDVDITTRISDFDPMGHVNNSVYFDYVETMLFSYLDKEIKIKKIKIQYVKEIDKSVKSFKSGILEEDMGYKFKIFDENKIFAYGEVEI